MKIFEEINSCRICNSSDLEVVLDLGLQPPANSLYKPEDIEPTFVPLKLCFCLECQTAQISASIEPNFLFSKYVWVTGTSETANQYGEYFADETLKRSVSSNPKILEIASNDGTFLKKFIKRGCQVIGVDPAKNISDKATSEGVNTIAEFFNEAVSEKLISEYTKFDVVIARNVIPHVKEIHGVIKGMKIALNNSDSIGVIEFHDSSLLQNEMQYDYIYHEHLFYYTLHSLSNLLEKYDLFIFDLIRSPISGGSWVVYFSKEKRPSTQALLRAKENEENQAINKLSSWIEFGKKANVHRKKLQDLIFNSRNKLVAYGASARSSTLINFCNIDNRFISFIIDKNPLKEKLLTPGSKIEIRSLQDGLKYLKDDETIFLMAWNFKDEIVSELRKYKPNLKFLIPFPNDPTII